MKTVSIREAARRLGCSRRHVYRLVHSGDVPAVLGVRPGRGPNERWEIPVDAIRQSKRRR